MPWPIPPFERFYEEHRDEVFGFLVRRLGRRRPRTRSRRRSCARCAPTPPRARRYLRAWVYTIAARVAVDACAAEPVTTCQLGDGAGRRGPRPAYLELEHLAEELPPTERAAVVLRYGYDLDYADIGAALGSTAEAARQAASSGHPPAAQEGGLDMKVPPDLDAASAAAAAAGLLDVAYDVVDSPLGDAASSRRRRAASAGSRTTPSPSAWWSCSRAGRRARAALAAVGGRGAAAARRLLRAAHDVRARRRPRARRRLLAPRARRARARAVRRGDDVR